MPWELTNFKGYVVVWISSGWSMGSPYVVSWLRDFSFPISSSPLEKLNANCGKWEFTVPKSIPSGDYLIRAEVIALHAASASGGAQYAEFIPNSRE